MNALFTRHPFIGLIMVGIICVTVVETADIIVNGERKIKTPFSKKNEDEIESVEV